MKLILFSIFIYSLNLPIFIQCKNISAEESNQLLRHFNRYKVYQISNLSQEQFKLVSNLYDNGEFDFWTRPNILGPTDIMAGDNQIPELLEYFQTQNITYNVMIDDVEKLVSNERKLRLRSKSSTMDWETYHEYDLIMSWMTRLSRNHPGIVKVFSIGKSYEGRDLKVIKISTSSGEKGLNKRAIFIDGTQHSREWISPAVATYFINELVKNSLKYKTIFDSVDFYILPIVNPDGYVYSFSTHRLWRKSRSVLGDSLLGCRGVDLNRNFDSHFGEKGSGSLTCSETYRGKAPFSEPETEAIRNFILNYNENGYRPNWKSYISLHSYGQYFLYPYGFAGELPDDSADLIKVAEESVKIMKGFHGTQYTSGNSHNLLYAASGTSTDWAKMKAGIKYSYTIELRGARFFSFGFLLPSVYIKDCAEETFGAILNICRYL